jgi:hypothetical protein
VLDLRDELSIARAEEYEPGTELADGLLDIVAHNQREPDLTRLFTVLAAESIAPEHPGHARFQERYRGVRTALAHGIAEDQRAGRLNTAIDPVELATLLTAVMVGLQLQFLLDPETVDMVGPLRALLALLRPS